MTPELRPSAEGRWWPAPAKLNLFLHVTGRRPDGYHELQTLFQLLDWGDDVWLRTRPGREIIRRRAAYHVNAEADLAILAARALQEAAGARAGAEIEVRKRIPLGGGLGGGSSDAATVLVVLNRLWGCGLGADELAHIGFKLGADVPVFVHGRTAVGTGAGEALAPAELGPRHYVLVMPDIRISTREVFSDPELRRDSSPISDQEILQGKGRNDCQPVVCARHPEMSQLLSYLGRYGDPRMSGTGSAVFIPMSTREAAERAAAALRAGSASELKCRYNVRAVGGLDRSPLHLELGI